MSYSTDQTVSAGWDAYIQATSRAMGALGKLSVEQGMLLDQVGQGTQVCAALLQQEAARLVILKKILGSCNLVAMSASGLCAMLTLPSGSFSGGIKEVLAKVIPNFSSAFKTQEMGTIVSATGAALGYVGSGVVSMKMGNVERDQTLVTSAIDGQTNQIGAKTQEGLKSIGDAQEELGKSQAEYFRDYRQSITVRG